MSIPKSSSFQARLSLQGRKRAKSLKWRQGHFKALDSVKAKRSTRSKRLYSKDPESKDLKSLKGLKGFFSLSCLFALAAFLGLPPTALAFWPLLPYSKRQKNREPSDFDSRLFRFS